MKFFKCTAKSWNDEYVHKKGFVTLCQSECQLVKISNEVRMEFFAKNKNPAMTIKMHLAHLSLASN